jgi:DNA-binding NarL/FixJ family response regulator
MSITHIETGAVLHRHHQAMALVEDLPDEETRLALLDFVVSGNPAVEAAFRAKLCRKKSPHRRAAVIELRARGMTLRQIADELGYADESGPQKVLANVG